ncbi:MAG TPA: aldehyde ferredoxin oxidoreductase family protein, partial [Anaerolineae bacterium]|nr:aldehyde ferredoxin oxidoreductase family protein [Anaerolineae bacterium]
MALGGYADHVGHIDLSSGKVTYAAIPEEWKLKYIGGRGVGVKYVFENGPKVDPLSPANILCFMNGPLTGSEANMSGRMAICTKSPLTGTITDSHHGGWSAARLRWAGFDGLIFKGKATKPVYVYVHDGAVEILDASEVWGKGVHDTVKHFKAKYGEKDLSVIAIGQGGEHLVKFACWVNEDDRASGRGGTGCVGGSKNLKAVVIKAEKKMVKAADRDKWKAAHQKALAEIMDERVVTAPRKGGLSVYGTNVLMNMTNVIGGLPAKNSQFTAFGDQAELISGEYVKQNILVDDPTCHACPVACKKEVEVKEGPWKGLHMESVEYEPAWSVGANCGNSDINTVAKMIDLCNDYGIDAIETGHPLSIWMEATQRAYTNGDGGLKWGDIYGMTDTVRKIAFREGIGNIMADGANVIAKHFGHPELAMTVKGQGIPAYDPRGIKGMGLGYATSNRGACHLRAYTPAAEVIGNVLGPSTITDPLAWKGKGELTIIFQNVHTVTDCLDVCKFATFAESLDSFAAQYEAITGVESNAGHLLKVGERVYNLERYYNNLNGFGEGSDYLPDRFTKEASTMPGSMGQVCELDQMLVEYYDKRGWKNGVVPMEKLK